MTIRLLFVGKNKGSVDSLVEDFKKKIRPFCHLEIIIIKDESGNSDTKKIREREAGRIFNILEPKDFLIALDEKGKLFDTITFSREFEKLIQKNSTLHFLIGSSFGLSKDIKERANILFSLSPLTMSHQIARLVLLEQLYRIFTLQRGIDYHR